MSFKNAAFRPLINLKNAGLRLLRKSRYGVLLEESVRWVFGRLPLTFTAPLAAIAVVYFVLLYPLLVYRAVPWLLRLPGRGLRWMLPVGHAWETSTVWYVASAVYHHFLDIVSALLTLGVALAGFIVSHAVACLCYRCWRGLGWDKEKAKAPPAPRVVRPSGPAARDEGAGAAAPNPLERFSRIGIILAGGGAKGAYQAGALKAVYEFLEKHGAHDKVKMIAGTSIGSWNALFWLADAVKDEVGEDGLRRPAALEAWWKGVNVSCVIKPVKYLPTKQNFFLSNQPWQETFDHLFGEHTEAGRRMLEHMDDPDDPHNINFYFTCTNIKEARLEVTTNDNKRVERRDPYLGGTDRLANMKAKIARSLDEVRFGVFSSMDLPPLFEYAAPGAGQSGNGNGASDFYEDGGVIDNLPIYFGTEVEECDLLFILPLNASFEQQVNHSSLIKRLARVTSIRQGVLERKAFKDIYLFNESAYLRELAQNQDAALREVLGHLEDGAVVGMPEAGRLAERVRGVLADPPPADAKAAELTPLQRALRRRHKPVQVFSICPKPKPKLRINTAEFWKTEEAGRAFDRMYQATREGLEQKFEWLISQNFVTMVQIPDEGDPELFTDF